MTLLQPTLDVLEYIGIFLMLVLVFCLCRWIGSKLDQKGEDNNDRSDG